MRTFIPYIVFAGLLAPWASAISQDGAKPHTSMTAKQLSHIEVGSTHVPVQANPNTYVNPYADNNEAIVQGRKLFNSMNCVGCHASQGGGGMGPPLSDSEWIYGGRPEQIYMSILQGRPNGMPAFGKALPEDSIWKLVSYIKTLSSTPPQSNHSN